MWLEIESIFKITTHYCICYAFFASQGALCVSLKPLEQMKAHFIRKKDGFSLLCILVSPR